MGKCLTIVKLVGIGSLGLSTGALLLSSSTCIPGILTKSENVASLKEKVSKLIVNLRLGFWSLGSLATYLFYQAYTYSPAYGKHPYLIYAAAAFPIALVFNCYFAFAEEQKLINDSEEQVMYKTEKKTVKELAPSEEENSPLDNSVYNDLGTQAPKYLEKEIEVQVPHTVKIELAEETYKSILSNVSKNYLYSAAIMGTGFLISAVGYIGDSLK